jgi:glycosyltransferase involved in cell wall biosynthesis
MSDVRQADNVLVIDPGCFTPDYDSEICRALARRGLRVSLVTAPHQNDSSHQFSADLDVRERFFRAPGFPRRRHARTICKGLTYPYYWGKLLELMQEERPQIVHFQWFPLRPVDLLYLRRLRRQHPYVAVVATIHDVDPRASALGERCLPGILALADGVIVHGQASRATLLRRFPCLDPDRVHVAAHGPLYVSDLAAVEEAPGVRSRKHVALVFGEIKGYKGLDILARGLCSLNPEDKARLKIVVAGKLEETACKTHLEQLRHTGVEVDLRVGYVPNKEVASLFRAADLALLPYKSGTQSGVLLTALAQGRAVIASAVGDLPELVSATQGGWCVMPSDPAALAVALHQALAIETGDLRRRGMLARGRLLAEFAWDSTAVSTLACYGKALDHRRNAGLVLTARPA